MRPMVMSCRRHSWTFTGRTLAGLVAVLWAAWTGIRDASAEESAQGDAIFTGDLIPGISPVDLQQLSVPLRDRDPERFWLNQRVFQKSGIIVEDRDYIVRERYWLLDSYDVGRVTEVKKVGEGIRCTVLFDSNERWQQKSFEKKLESETTVSTTVVPAREGFRTESLVSTYRHEGVAVQKAKCGLIVKHVNEKAVYVEFPAALLCYELPRVNDRVTRGPDWLDGHVDGWREPTGPSDANTYSGEVIAPRDLDGSIDIFWPVTGRTTTHRFDNYGGFVDVQKIVVEEPKP